jgi:hypothetical protein
MADHWQDLIALAIVALAAAYLARTFARLFRPGRSGGCATGCGKCGNNRPATSFPTRSVPADIISIGPPPRHSR